MAQAFFIRPIWIHESRFVPSLLFPAVFAFIQDGNQLFTNSLGKPCGGGNNNKTIFFSFFLHNWLYLLMTPALNMLVIPGLPSYNGVEVYYLKGVIGLPIVISFRDRWYILIYFFFWKWAHWWRHRHRLDRFRFQNFQSPDHNYTPNPTPSQKKPKTTPSAQLEFVGREVYIARPSIYHKICFLSKWYLMITAYWQFLLFFFPNKRFDTSCKLSPFLKNRVWQFHAA